MVVEDTERTQSFHSRAKLGLFLSIACISLYSAALCCIVCIYEAHKAAFKEAASTECTPQHLKEVVSSQRMASIFCSLGLKIAPVALLTHLETFDAVG